jgi:aldehyde:ferredoxin oxidoreductase
MARGCMGRTLWVDLTKGMLWEETPDDALFRDYIGGYGVGARVLYDRMKGGVDPLGPDNILGFIAGPLTGTPALVASRFTMVGKSPLTKTWGDANSGGDFGPALKHAGYDAVFVVGAAASPVYLVLKDGAAEIRDATPCWGMLTTDFEDAMKEQYGAKSEVLAIGPAGEAMSLISCPITAKGRTPGRSGLGAVMGSKKLKAIVALGELEVPVADPQRLAELRRKYLRTLDGFFADMYKNSGTPALVEGSVISGDAPVKNWSAAAEAEGWDASPLFVEQVLAKEKKKWNCWRCPLACGGDMEAGEDERHLSHKPEYETICAFGTACLNNDLASVIKCNNICNAYGLDTMSAGATVAFAMECYANGLISQEDTGGLDLTWGNSEAIVAVTEQMARREGFGAILADGSKVAAERIGKGAERFAMHVQGQELPMHDPKASPGMGTIYHIDDTPGRHMHGLGFGITFPSDWLLKQGIQPGDQFEYGANGEAYKRLTTIANVVNAAGLCMFGWFSQDPDYLVDFLNAVTGWDYTFETLHTAGERIANMRHAFNLREGQNPRKWAFPGRMIGNPPIGKGPLGQTTVDLEANEVAYLRAFGWDPETTRPSALRLAELGLEDVAQDLGITA